ncbi:hypothetical protein [Cellulomonas sp. ATA003]|uniref:hypothetical protein n=1 Tax=Cellulomonas sp. ATA003 TaxID=3073064 RepID=UPI002872F593|nr:hypothetical protein [Cellulomonas sp. ATA003]WNB84459.1 hypothetical protein REH70_11425 [Cellulomonas sp. ATA003]
MAARHDDTGDAPDRHDPRDDEIAERWAEIVADLGRLDADDPDERPDPARGDVADDPQDDLPATDEGAGRAVTYPVAPWVSARPAARELTGRDWAGTDDIDAAEAEIDDRDHFVPPDPGPVLGGDPLLTMAWLGAAGVPILLLITLVAWQDAPTALLQAAGVVFLASCALLVWRMPHRRDDDDGPGAVV